MNYVTLAILVLAVAVFVLALKLLKSIFKTVVLFVLLIFAAVSLLGIVVTVDMIDYSKDLKNNQNTFLLQQNGTLIAGFHTDGLNISTAEPVGDLSELNEHYEDQEYDEMVDNSTLVIFDNDSLESVEELEQFASPQGSFLLSLIVTTRKDPLFMLKEYRKGNVEVYPKSISMRIVDVVL